MNIKSIYRIFALTYLIPTCALVWENDPNMTPEECARAKEINEKIRQRNKERETTMHQEIAEATEQFIKQIEKIRAKYPPIVG